MVSNENYVMIYSYVDGIILNYYLTQSRKARKVNLLKDPLSYLIVEKDNEIFLKTAFPSRKYTKRYGLKGE